MYKFIELKTDFFTRTICTQLRTNIQWPFNSKSSDQLDKFPLY